jgi:anti-repressor protein
MTVALGDGHSGQRGGAQFLNLVNEPGLYSLVLRSRKSEAKEFKRWITHEVVPSIREHGGYLTPALALEAQLSPDEFIAKALIMAKDSLDRAEARNKELIAQNEIQAIHNKELITANEIQAAEIDTKAAKIEADQPKVEFADNVLASDLDIEIGELSALLKNAGIDIGRNTLFKILRDEGWVGKAYNSGRYNMPLYKAVGPGYLKQVHKPVTDYKGEPKRNPVSGDQFIDKLTLVTPAGQMFFLEHFKKKFLKPAQPMEQPKAANGIFRFSYSSG